MIQPALPHKGKKQYVQNLTFSFFSFNIIVELVCILYQNLRSIPFIDHAVNISYVRFTNFCYKKTKAKGSKSIQFLLCSQRRLLEDLRHRSVLQCQKAASPSSNHNWPSSTVCYFSQSRALIQIRSSNARWICTCCVRLPERKVSTSVGL